MEKNPLVGVWKLISCEAIRANGTRVPIYGRDPLGILFYDAGGNMSVNIMKSRRSRCKGATKFAISDEEMKAAYETYEAYFSRYEVDVHRQTVQHKVVGSLFPNWTGSTQRRYYSLVGGDLLKLSTAPIGSKPEQATIVELVWERCGEPHDSVHCA